MPGRDADDPPRAEPSAAAYEPACVLRSATPEDIASVLGLWEAAGGTPSVSDTPEGLSRLLAADPDALILAVDNGAVIGSLIAGWDGWRGSFYRLAVHPDRRRQGLALALLRAGESRLRKLGAARFTAIVVEQDPRANGFWRAAGYQRQPQRARFIRRP